MFPICHVKLILNNHNFKYSYTSGIMTQTIIKSSHPEAALGKKCRIYAACGVLQTPNYILTGKVRFHKKKRGVLSPRLFDSYIPGPLRAEPFKCCQFSLISVPTVFLITHSVAIISTIPMGRQIRAERTKPAMM